MFSPEASSLSARSSLRNPRRRQRKDSDGIQQQQPRRKRSKLSEDVFHQIPDAHTNGNGSVTMNGHAARDGLDNSLVLVDMPVREKKAPIKRALQEDWTMYLTKNANYGVKKLPSFPQALTRTSRPFRATALTAAGLALALTSEHALVWDYTVGAAPTRVLSLPLPFASKPSDPLPLGAVVRNGPTNDFGVVAVAPSSGKITFWENVDSADARNHFPQRHLGVNGSVKLYHGELVTDLVDIEHAGFVLIVSSGRLVQLTLRDSQGRPSIAATVLNAPSSASGGFFSFKGLLGNPIRKTMASVKARPSESKGQMEVITATRSGLFQLWDLSWSGQQIFKREIDVQGDILSALQSGNHPESHVHQEVQVLDFAMMGPPQVQGAASLLLLVAILGDNALNYFLVEVDLASSNGIVSRAIPIQNFHQSEFPKEPSGSLMLPWPGHTAFVRFPGAVFIASLAEPEESPDAQLLADSGRSSIPFQDTIYFRNDISANIAGYSADQTIRKDEQSIVLLFVQGYGVLQINALPPSSHDGDNDKVKVTAQSKLEQATFFSSVPENILDFSIRDRYSFSEVEATEAALAISSKILSSSYEHLNMATSSMDAQFTIRAFALRNLVEHLRADYPPLSLQSKWNLLCHAEKLAAAHALWNWYMDKLADQEVHPDAYPEKIIMGDIIKALHERYKTLIRRELGETDPIRQFFIKDVDSLNILLPWAWNYLRSFYINDSTKERPSVMQRLGEANDVLLVCLETAFSFRLNNIERYALSSESLDASGVLKPGHGYDALSSQFWTSTHNIVCSIRSLVDVGRNIAEESFEHGIQEDLAQKIGRDNPRLVQIGCQTHIERFQWGLEQSDEKLREMGRSLREEWHVKVRPPHIYGLMDIGLATEGMALAEQYKDMPTLVNLTWDEFDYLEIAKNDTNSKMEHVQINIKQNRIKERINRYFNDFGDAWAEAFYRKHIVENQTARLFTKDFLNQPALTRFLRADPARARLGWINEVSNAKNYEAGAEALCTAAKQETNAWCSRVELSLAKLTMMCNPDAKSATETGERSKEQKAFEAKFTSTCRQLEYTKIQDLLYGRLLPTITGALDDDSAVELLMAEFGQGRLQKRPALQSILRRGFESLVEHRVLDPALMIDILTLMNSDEPVSPNSASPSSESALVSNEFFFALKVMMLSWHNIHRNARDGLLKLIWKRMSIRDDWDEINKTKDVSDLRLSDFLAATTVGWTWRQFLQLLEEDPSARCLWPKNLQEWSGAGCTHGELCVRFPSEDLRAPIMADNLADDAILENNIEKHRFDEWFEAAIAAGEAHYESSKMEGQQQTALTTVESDDSASVSGDERAQEGAAAAAQGSVENRPDQDVEMGNA